MRAAGVGDSPPGHRTAWVDPSRLPERTNGFVVVERVEEFQSLIEIALGFGRGGRHRTAARAQPVKKRLAHLRVGGLAPAWAVPARPIVRRKPNWPQRSTQGKNFDAWWELRLSGIELAFRRQQLNEE